MLAIRGFPWRSLIVTGPILVVLAGYVAFSCAAAAEEPAPTKAATKRAATAKQTAAKPADAPAGGKVYAVVKVADPPAWKKIKTTMIAEGKAADKESLDVFTQHYLSAIGELTQPGLRDLFAKNRYELKRQLNALGNKPDTSLHQALLTLMQTNLPKIFKGEDYHPASRVNCLYLYGDLNSKEGAVFTGVGAVPLAAALPELTAVLKNADNKYSVPMQLAALCGVVRHAESTMTAEQRGDLVKTMLSWLRKPPAQGASQDVQNFVRRRAVEVLRLLAAKGPEANTAEVAGLLHQFAADEEVPLDDRCEAARALGTLESKSFPAKSVPTVARNFATLAALVSRQTAAPATIVEEEEPADADENQPAEGANDAAAGAKDGKQPAAGKPPAAEPPAEEKSSGQAQLVLAPELQWYLLACVRTGLEGPEPGKGRGLAQAASDDTTKTLIAELGRKVEGVIKVVSRKKKDEQLNETEIEKLQAMADELLELVKPGTQPPLAASEGAPRS